MKLFIYIILLVTLAKYCHVYPCSGSSCRPRPSCNSQNCDSSYDCTETCDSSYSCRGTCDAWCCESSSCCESRCCRCPCPKRRTTTSPPGLPPTHPTSPPWTPTPPSWPPTFPSIPNITVTSPSSSSSCNNTNINNNNNTVTIPTNITIQNEIHSETRITIPVNITVNNVNNIQISPAFAGGNLTNGGSNHTPSGSNITIYNITTEIINNTVETPYPILVPIPIPYVITMPRPQPVPTGCCRTVQPCMPYDYCGCHQSSFHCSNKCFNPYSYQPIDVCNNGCFRRNMAVGQQCSFGGCYHGFVKCSSCNKDFYQSYDEFLRCAGCFVPMPWGQVGTGPMVGSNISGLR